MSDSPNAKVKPEKQLVIFSNDFDKNINGWPKDSEVIEFDYQIDFGNSEDNQSIKILHELVNVISDRTNSKITVINNYSDKDVGFAMQHDFWMICKLDRNNFLILEQLGAVLNTLRRGYAQYFGIRDDYMEAVNDLKLLVDFDIEESIPSGLNQIGNWNLAVLDDFLMTIEQIFSDHFVLFNK